MLWLIYCPDVQIFHRMTLRWKINASGLFTVKSLYSQLLNSSHRFPHPVIWEVKLPLKNKIFLWYFYLRGSSSLKTIFVRGTGRKKDKLCSFCPSFETIEHLKKCPMARFIWQVVAASFGCSTPYNILHRCLECA